MNYIIRSRKGGVIIEYAVLLGFISIFGFYFLGFDLFNVLTSFVPEDEKSGRANVAADWHIKNAQKSDLVDESEANTPKTTSELMAEAFGSFSNQKRWDWNNKTVGSPDYQQYLVYSEHKVAAEGDFALNEEPIPLKDGDKITIKYSDDNNPNAASGKEGLYNGSVVKTIF